MFAVGTTLTTGVVSLGMSCARVGDAIIEVTSEPTMLILMISKPLMNGSQAYVMQLLRDNPIPRIAWVNRVAHWTDTSNSGRPERVGESANC